MRNIPNVRLMESSATDTKGTFSYAPLAPGYAVTIGNSLRRVLLSSVPGCGIHSIAIEGVKHKFSTIDGMKEDIIHFIQYLKKVRFRFISEFVDKVKLRLEAKGPTVVMSSMISSPESTVEVLDDLYLCTLNPGCHLKCDIFIEKGYGYVDSTRSTEVPQAGRILIDNVLNAVRRAHFDFENIRYGEYTDYEMLKLEIETDGSIAPSAALDLASSILLQQFAVVGGHSQDNFLAGKDKGAEKMKANLAKSVKDIGLSDKTVAALQQFDINTVGDLINCTEAALLNIPRFGRRKIQDIQEALAALGLGLKDNKFAIKNGDESRKEQ